MADIRVGLLLFLKMLVGVMGVLTFYYAIVLRPQIRFLERKMGLPEYEGTVHQKTMRFSLSRLQSVSRRLRMVILLIGLFWLGIFPMLLR